jgi:hypothetical protein
MGMVCLNLLRYGHGEFWTRMGMEPVKSGPRKPFAWLAEIAYSEVARSSTEYGLDAG